MVERLRAQSCDYAPASSSIASRRTGRSRRSCRSSRSSRRIRVPATRPSACWRRDPQGGARPSRRRCERRASRRVRSLRWRRLPRYVQIHHYKWDSTVLDRLRERLTAGVSRAFPGLDRVAARRRLLRGARRALRSRRPGGLDVPRTRPGQRQLRVGPGRRRRITRAGAAVQAGDVAGPGTAASSLAGVAVEARPIPAKQVSTMKATISSSLHSPAARRNSSVGSQERA